MQSNLAVFVKASTSLQNDDITPAAFWITNANNTVVNNHAAGGSHFGFWYRMHEHPDGPSYDANYCPRHIPLGVFRNNTVHSQGWFGIWIFQEYHPMEEGKCENDQPIAAKYETLTAWNNEKGAESVDCGAIQFHNFLLVNNKVAGIEMKLLTAPVVPYSETRGSMLKGCCIAARPTDHSILAGGPTGRGVILPYGRGLIMKDMTFVNFDTTEKAVFGVTTVQGTTEDDNGGYTYRISNTVLYKSPNVISYRWIHEGQIKDLDGSLTGITNGVAVPETDILPDSCTHNVQGFSVNPNVPGSVCPASVKFLRFSFNNPKPESLAFKNVSFVNDSGRKVIGKWKKKRVTHKLGWMVTLPSKGKYEMKFEDGEQISEISYDGTISDLGVSTYFAVF